MEQVDGKTIIASPAPKPEHYNRIIAEEYPSRTFSKSIYDAPLRNEVQQIDIPNQITKVVTEKIDPRLPLKQPVETFNGPLIHNTGSTDERIVHGLPSFLEKSGKYKMRNLHKKNNQIPNIEQAHQHLQTGISHAKSVWNRSSEHLGILKNGIAPHINPAILERFERGTDMIIPVQTTNKLETPSLRLYDNHKAIQENIEALKDTPIGIRSLNTYRRLK